MIGKAKRNLKGPLAFHFQELFWLLVEVIGKAKRNLKGPLNKPVGYPVFSCSPQAIAFKCQHTLLHISRSKKFIKGEMAIPYKVIKGQGNLKFRKVRKFSNF